LHTISPQKFLPTKVDGADLTAEFETGKDQTLDQLIQSQHQTSNEKDADSVTYKSNLDTQSKMLYSKI